MYDAENDCYWCPEGNPLSFTGTTTELRNGRERVRYRYHSAAEDCIECPLRSLCLKGKTKYRAVAHEQHESLRTKHAKRMATDEAKKKYLQRLHAGERPFAIIKTQFGARRFLLRGVDKVKQEWRWLATAFNLHRLFGLIRSGVDPP